MLRWDQYGFDKKHAGTRYTELVFLHSVGFMGHVVHSGASEARNIDVLFFMHGVGPALIARKVCWNTLHQTSTEYMVLHLMGYAGHVGHCSVFGARNAETLFFMLMSVRYGFDKKHIGTHYTEFMFLHPTGSAGHVVHSGLSAAQNIDAVFFMLRWAWCRFDKKHVKAHYAEHVFLHPVGSERHIVHSGASRTWNIDAIFFKLEVGPVRIPQKNAPGYFTLNMCFCIQWDLQVQ
jgi:hypothetical protein